MLNIPGLFNKGKQEESTPTMDREITFAGGQDYNNSNIVQMRLDTNPILQEIREYLTGKQVMIKVNERTGEEEQVYVHVGEPLCNDEGTNGIMRKMRLLINQHVSQGNYDLDWYFWNLGHFHKHVATSIISNRYVWAIDTKNAYTIIEELGLFYNAFLSRLLYNEERKSLTSGDYRVHQVLRQGEGKNDKIGAF